jgi:DNA-binding NtrC family response regulator
MEGREAGIDILERVRALYGPDVPVILMSAVGTREAGFRAVNAGAFAFLQKPFRNEALESQVSAALAQVAMRTTARAVAQGSAPLGGKQAQSRRHNHPGARRPGTAEPLPSREHELIGESPAFRECLALVEQAAATDVTVLLEGESGVGKGAFASHVHAISARASQPFIAVNCGAFTETLLESQLFGHLKGSFTGADRDAIGFVRAADGGTLFLDEVGELTPAMQVKLLRVLQEREVIPVGGTQAHRVDVRFVAATNRDLREDVLNTRFREDLFWRLHVMSIRVPALRERAADLPLLTTYMLDRLRARDTRLSVTGLSPDALAVLAAHGWPGNVRELENALTRAAVVATGTIEIADLPLDIRATSVRGTPVVRPGTALAAMPSLALIERLYVDWVVAGCAGDEGVAAQRLGLPVGALRALRASAVPPG